ncbi:uncharacterized protein HaLaN_10533, partial [Haematococcus lacustris]
AVRQTPAQQTWGETTDESQKCGLFEQLAGSPASQRRFALKFCEDKFVQKYIPTIGVDYGVKPLRLGEYEARVPADAHRGSLQAGRQVFVLCRQSACMQLRVNFWDLAGPAEYCEVRNEFYKDAQGCLLVYDVTSRTSFENLPAWLDEAREHKADNMVIFVAATKADNPTRKVSEKEGRDWATSQGFQFFEVSSCSGQAVRPLFLSLFARLLATGANAPQELATAAAQHASAAREEEGR